MCMKAEDWGRSYSQIPSCGGGEPLPVMDFLLPVYKQTFQLKKTGIDPVGPIHQTGPEPTQFLSTECVEVIHQLLSSIPDYRKWPQHSPVGPPASSDSAGGCHMAKTSAVAGRGGASAAGCRLERPWWLADDRAIERLGGRAETGALLRLLPLPVIGEKTGKSEWGNKTTELHPGPPAGFHHRWSPPQWYAGNHGNRTQSSITAQVLIEINSLKTATPPPHLSPTLALLQQQVVETGCQLVVGDALTEAAVIILLQPPVQHHLQLTCSGTEMSQVNRWDTCSGTDEASPERSEATAWLWADSSVRRLLESWRNEEELIG